MRFSSLVREACLNIASGVTRAGLFALVFALVMGALACAEVASVGALEQQATNYQRVGATTIIYKAPAQIDGASCDALRTVRGVRAAGAVRASALDLTALALPSTTIPTFDVSPHFAGFTALAASGQPTTGVSLSAAAAATLSVKVGEKLALTEGSPIVRSIYQYPEDGRRAGMSYAILLPTDTRKPFDECWVEAWPQSDQIANLLPTTLISSGSPVAAGPPQVAQLNATLGIHFDGAALFSARISRFAAFAALACGFALGFMAVWIRRLELAAARHSGMRPAAQGAQMVLETASWVGIGLLFSVLAVVSVTAITPAVNAAALWMLGFHVLIGAAPATLLGALAATIVIREKALFRYFKNR